MAKLRIMIPGAALTAIPIAALAASPPSAGYYTATVFIVEATGPKNTCQFVATQGQTYTGVLFYPGSGKQGATLRVARAMDDGMNVELNDFPKTPNATSRNWKGPGHAGFEGSQLAPMDFQGTLFPLSASAFTMTMVVKVHLGDGTCTYGANLAAAKTGN